MKKVSCPNCGKEVEWSPDSRFKPFCSERCRLIDLGAWANEDYSIPSAPADPMQDNPENQQSMLH